MYFQLLMKAIMISGFVFIMMVLIEYVNVQTKGLWRKAIEGSVWKQYLFGALMGAIPGCLGAFTMVALFSHRLVSFGALVTTMIATSGDEAFVMFSMFPQKALLLTGLLIVVGLMAGYLSDRFIKPTKIMQSLGEQTLLLDDYCKCFDRKTFWLNIKRPTLYRVLIVLLVSLLIVGLQMRFLAGGADLWVRVTLLLAFSFALFVAISVPNHFLEEHIWNHIVKKHLPRIFLWVFGVLVVMHWLMNYMDVEAWISSNLWVVLLLAIVLGVVPESGPHLVFVTLFATGAMPFSILIASSIAQDGHGMLPLLAESKRAFVAVKLVNIVVAFVIGALGLLVGM